MWGRRPSRLLRDTGEVTSATRRFCKRTLLQKPRYTALLGFFFVVVVKYEIKTKVDNTVHKTGTKYQWKRISSLSSNCKDCSAVMVHHDLKTIPMRYGCTLFPHPHQKKCITCEVHLFFSLVLFYVVVYLLQGSKFGLVYLTRCSRCR